MKKQLIYLLIFIIAGFIPVKIVKAVEIINEEVDLLEYEEYVESYTSNATAAKQYIEQCMRNKQAVIDVSAYQLTQSDIKSIYSDIINYTPDLFYINNKYSITLNPETRYVNSIKKFYYYANADYSANTAEIAKKSTEIENAIKSIKAIVDTKTSKFEKILCIHDYLIEHCAYDYSAVLNGNGNTATYPKTDFDMYGTLVLSSSVCQGYSHAFKYICEQLGIGNVGFATTNNHIWNQIQIGSNYFNIDLTYDDYTYDIAMKASHINFLKSDTVFKKSHGSYTGDYSCTSVAYDNIPLNDIFTHLSYINGKYYYVSNNCLKYFTIDKSGNIKYASYSVQLPDSWTYTNCYMYSEKYLFYNTKKSIYLYRLSDGKYLDYKITGDNNIFAVSISDNKVNYWYRYRIFVTNSVVETKSSFNFSNSDLNKIGSATKLSDTSSKPVKYVKISSSAKSIPKTSTLELGAKYYPEDADNVKSEKWSSSNKSVATVNKNGVVKAKSTGTAIIIYTVNDSLSASCKVTVYNYGLTKISSKYYFYNEKGNRVRNQWKTINGKKYYFGKKYYAVTGWQKIKGKKYYFNSNSTMAIGWKKIKGAKYYFGSNGKMRTGWVKIGKYKYYFNKKGVFKKKKRT